MRPRVKVKAGGRVPWGEEGNLSVAAHMWCVGLGSGRRKRENAGSQDSILKVGKGRIVRVAGRVWAWSDWWFIRPPPTTRHCPCEGWGCGRGMGGGMS